MKLVVENLSKNYGKKVVLQNINFTFEEGKIYGLIGRNGVGKTTFFNALNEDIDITSGNIKLIDNNYNNKLSSSDIGYVISTPIVPDQSDAERLLTVDKKKKEVMRNDLLNNAKKIKETEKLKLEKDMTMERLFEKFGKITK